MIVAAHPPTWLVVDDSGMVRRHARRLLEDLGCIVREAADGLAALLACRQALPDFILLDWIMPVMNGIQFLQALRAEFGAGGPPVMICTTQNGLASIATALGQGAQEFIMKPFDAGILASKVHLIGSR